MIPVPIGHRLLFTSSIYHGIPGFGFHLNLMKKDDDRAITSKYLKLLKFRI